MGLLINNDLIWISIPKCASTSIEDALLESNLEIEKHWRHYKSPNDHLHIKVDELYHYFGKKDTISITRDPLERWISSLKTIWLSIMFRGYTPIIKFEDIDNDFLYKTFDTTFINNLHNYDTSEQCNFLIMKDYVGNPLWPNFKLICNLMVSQNYWKGNEKCTYEFNINELDKVQEFFYKKYKKNIHIPHINPNDNLPIKSLKRETKIIIDDELKNWYWESFEKRFEKTNKLI